MNRPSVGEAQSYHETIPSYLGLGRLSDLRGIACAIVRHLDLVRPEEPHGIHDAERLP
jgi:hypothetical protein